MLNHITYCPNCGRKLQTSYITDDKGGLYHCVKGQHQWEVSCDPDSGELQIKGYIDEGTPKP